MKSPLNIIAIWALTLLSSCDFLAHDNDPELPPITTEGRGTFGCLVNGDLFLPDAPFGYGTGVYAELYKNDTLTAINIYAGNNITKQTFFISLVDEPQPQVDFLYDLGDTKRCGIQYLNYFKLPSCEYEEVINGSIKLLKFDITSPQHMIIAGTFEFTTSSQDCNDTIIVASGRFDISDVIR